MTTLATVDPNVRDHMTGVQLRLIRQKLDEERAAAGSLRSTPVTPRVEDHEARLRHAKLLRQDLIEQLKNEHNFGEVMHTTGRPHSGRLSRSPRLTPPPSRRAASLPPGGGGGTNLHAPHQYYNGAGHGGHSPRNVVEHHVRPVRLDPIANAPQPPPPTVIAVPQSQPQYYPPTNTKQEMMEMMMMQNAQMHNMMMQQMMMSSIPKPQANTPIQNRDLQLDLDDIIHLKSEKKRPPSVHHHHYTPPPPQLPPVQHHPLPPLYPSSPSTGIHNWHQHPYYSPRYYPMEVEPLKQPVARKKKTPKYVPPPFNYGPLPFPGPWALRKFRHAAYATYFAKSVNKLLKLKKQGKAKKDIHANIPEDFLFGIRLKEAIAALHHIYLSPETKINEILRRISAENARDLTVVLYDNTSSKDKTDAYADLAYIIENTAYEITEIMPSSGVLGTHRKAVVFDMLQNGKLYPRGYMWQIEKGLMKFDYNGRTVNVGDLESLYLLLGIFIGRGLVTTLCLRPSEYGLLRNRPTPRAEGNLKLVASIYIYLLRRVYSNKGKDIPPLPYEIGKFLHKDAQLQTTYNKLKKSFDYAEKLLREWGNEYQRRIRNAPA